MQNYLTSATGLSLALATFIAIMPAAQADIMEACEGANGEFGLQFNLAPFTTDTTNCIHQCTSGSAVTAGAAISLNGEPVTECHSADFQTCTTDSRITIGITVWLDGDDSVNECHTVDECPLFQTTGVIVDGEEFCYLPTFGTCPMPYLPTPTAITGVPGYDTPLLLCIGASALGCETGIGTEVNLYHNGERYPLPLCV